MHGLRRIIIAVSLTLFLFVLKIKLASFHTRGTRVAHSQKEIENYGKNATSAFNNHHRHRRDHHHYGRNSSVRAASKQRRLIRGNGRILTDFPPLSFPCRLPPRPPPRSGLLVAHPGSSVAPQDVNRRHIRQWQTFIN